MTMQEMAALWPYNITDLSKGRATYAAETVTVAKVFDNAQGVALKFREDETPDGEKYKGVIWNVGGEWNEIANKSDRYAGPIPREGQSITVVVTRNPRNSGGYFTDCKITFDAPQQGQSSTSGGDQGWRPDVGDDPGPDAEFAENERPPGDYSDPPHVDPAPRSVDPVRDSIEKQVFYKDFNPDAVLMLEPERQAAMLEAYFETALELMSPIARSEALQAMRDMLEPKGEGETDGE